MFSAMALSTKSLFCQRFLSSLQLHTTSAKASQAKTRLPELPKRPPSAFLKFLQGERESLKAANPGISVTSLTKLAGEKWKDLPEEKKQEYKDAHVKGMTEWAAKKASIEEHLSKANLLGDIKAQMAAERVAKALKKAKAEKKKMAVDLRKPVRPPQPFNLYVKEYLDAHKQDKSERSMEKFRKASEKWKLLDEAGKAKYTEESMRLKEKYLAEMQAWTKEMEKEEMTGELQKANDKLSKLRSRKKKIDMEVQDL